MIKVFRKIRQNLFFNGKTGKYLVYAIGEIVLVVIGILIALSINNWNETKREQAILNASLLSLKLNLEEDIDNLNQQIKYNESVLEVVDLGFRIITLPEYKNQPLSESIAAVAKEKVFLPSATAFNSMESGAHFKWIKNQALTESIFKYYAFVNRVSGVTLENNQFVKNYVEEFMYSEMELGSFYPNANPYAQQHQAKTDNAKKVRESTVFKNALIGRRFRAQAEIGYAKEASKKATELINDIDIYLNEN